MNDKKNPQIYLGISVLIPDFLTQPAKVSSRRSSAQLPFTCVFSFLCVFSSSQVSEHYESSNLLTALPSSFLEPLLSFALMEEPEIRLLVLSILTSLIDRHHNAARLASAGSGDPRGAFPAS